MDLIFSNESSRNATLCLPSGQPVYDISTVPPAGQTTLRKYPPDNGAPVAIAVLEQNKIGADVCRVAGRSVLPEKTGRSKRFVDTLVFLFLLKPFFFTPGLIRKMVFVSSNGEEYIWKRENGEASVRIRTSVPSLPIGPTQTNGTVQLTDQHKNTVAFYEGSSALRGRRNLRNVNSGRGRLTIKPEGMAISDEIVATFIYVDQVVLKSRRVGAVARVLKMGLGAPGAAGPFGQ
ncbi:hypothetical protein V5O48_001078 [Marasmius crinis-equi]|uniref:DUF6593 domain-containing protein n=1 Tax=Marasmius crinis-equi TaxID=585013 RepID=A0ABR3FZL8_9AGAR